MGFRFRGKEKPWKKKGNQQAEKRQHKGMTALNFPIETLQKSTIRPIYQSMQSYICNQTTLPRTPKGAKGQAKGPLGSSVDFLVKCWSSCLPLPSAIGRKCNTTDTRQTLFTTKISALTEDADSLKYYSSLLNAKAGEGLKRSYLRNIVS